MNEFLPQLKGPIGHKVTNTTEQKDIFFRFSSNKKGAFVEVVDAKMKKVQVDYHGYSGDVFNVLRSLAIIEEKSKTQFSWDGDEPHIYLGDHAHLLYQLIRCNNLRDENGKTVCVSSSVAVPVLTIEEENKNVTTNFILTTGKGELNQFEFLTDSFVLADRTIYPVEPVGENFTQLFEFHSTFSIKMLETYLSIFYSYFDNIDLRYEDYTLERSSSELRIVPTLVVEKVEADNALFLHVENKVPEIDPEATERFDPTWLATLTEDRKVVLKRIIREPLDSVASNLKKLILSYAPNKDVKKDILRDGAFFIIPCETAGPFISEELSSLKKDYTLVGSKLLSKYKNIKDNDAPASKSL